MENVSNFAGNRYPLPKTVHMFTDGACSGNPGAGAYCCILQYKENEKIISDYHSFTTNNQMELTAVIKGLEAIRYPCIVEIVSDSKYVVDGATNWLPKWKANNWRRTNNKQIDNIGLWQQLDYYLAIHNVSFKWIKGHNQHFYNCKCDQIATDLIAQHQNGDITNIDTDAYTDNAIVDNDYYCVI